VRQTDPVDWRVKTFEPEAVEAFAFLNDRGFERSVEQPIDMGRSQGCITVRFRDQGTVVETRFCMAYAGEHSVDTTVQTVEGERQFGPTVAHTGHEMKKALREQASEVRQIVELL